MLRVAFQNAYLINSDWNIIKVEILSISEVWQRVDLNEGTSDVLDPPRYRREAGRSPVQAVRAGLRQVWLGRRANILSPDVVPGGGRQGMSTCCAILQ